MQQLASILQRRRTLENRQTPAIDPAFGIVATPQRSRSAASDWSTGAPPSGPATHKHQPRPLENNPARASYL